ncbi:hypothetical protein H8356DRAFT_962193 [Neocallimastix lanati (nom. inval.)]|uniref:Uncharacterized protein n=1 Tax=Neocallimastix californiae TaxID=1754190 RepID=A0A1Y2B151_9FUNG|nr:hypothetical protein H8356DRAFT_962193 [Neocallimastix sp. JGI-2020a]ORY28569.1 hypothetical protein LY90DRAFT_90253 [Neocallimastix californiae]|eukprot:ORY28569.1 hypothetical protein LY90DRAFT_90253 [Neocallimastix californiae]
MKVSLPTSTDLSSPQTSENYNNKMNNKNNYYENEHLTSKFKGGLTYKGYSI